MLATNSQFQIYWQTDKHQFSIRIQQLILNSNTTTNSQFEYKILI